MSELASLYVPPESLDLKDEVRQFRLITRRIRSLSVDPKSLIYCGFEGRDWLTTGKLTPRPTMYGNTYEEFEKLSKDIVHYGSAEDRTPLEVAFDAVDVPAIMGYEADLLEQSRVEHNLWSPKNDIPLQSAARVVLYFAN